MRQPAERRADLRAQLAANRIGALRLAELADRLGARAPARGDRRGARLRRAAHARLPGGSARRRRSTPRTCSRRPRATCVLRLRAAVAGERAAARLHRQRRPARRQPQLPARGHPLGVPVRGARAHRPRHPAVRRRLPADRGARAPRARVLNARRRRGGGGGQRRDLLARGRPRAGGVRARARARAR